jgi:rhamnosyltransferase
MKLKPRSPTTWPGVTVTVLTWNGQQYLDALLSAVVGQDYPGSFDVLVIDSGSTDDTLGIVARYPSVRLHEIPNAEFGHGRTRNLAAELSTGEVVAYLTHDSVPASPTWLRELVLPMADDRRIAAVLGRQTARAGAPPALKYDIRRVFDRLGPETGITVTWDTGRPISPGELAVATFYSDANSAARRAVLTKRVPYREVDYAEDQLFGRDLFTRGLRKGYAPHALVEHSNDTTLRTFGSRIAADLRGLRSIGTEIAPVSRFAAFKQWVKWSTADAADILLDRDYSMWQKIRWLLVNPWFQAAKWIAYRRASRAPLE